MPKIRQNTSIPEWESVPATAWTQPATKEKMGNTRMTCRQWCGSALDLLECRSRISGCGSGSRAKSVSDPRFWWTKLEKIQLENFSLSGSGSTSCWLGLVGGIIGTSKWIRKILTLPRMEGYLSLTVPQHTINLIKKRTGTYPAGVSATSIICSWETHNFYIIMIMNKTFQYYAVIKLNIR